MTEGAAGRISPVDPQTGQVTTFASGLPRSIIGFGGPTDITFIGTTAYVIVTLVGPQFGGSDIVGIYRVDGPASFTVIADIGPFALAESAGYTVRGTDGTAYAVCDRALPWRFPRLPWVISEGGAQASDRSHGTLPIASLGFDTASKGHGSVRQAQHRSGAAL